MAVPPHFAMRPLAALAVLLASAAAPAAQAPRPNPDAPATAYVGGLWWDGERFTPRDTTWAEAGVFVEGPLAEATRVVELGGAHVVPPYGDAHTHMLSDSWQGPRHAELFVRDGVFYVLVLTNRHSWAEGVIDQFRGPGSVDVAYAHGGWTSPRTHPVQVYEWQALGLVGRDLTDGDKRAIQESRAAADDAYFEVASLGDLDAKWPTFLSHAPDVVKVYLADAAAERPLSESGFTDIEEGRGLAPDVLREVVRRARAAGLRVFAHVETGADVALAVASGVDGFAHLPGYTRSDGADSLYLVPDSTVAEMARRGVVVVPTSLVSANRGMDRPAREALARDLHRRQVRRLHAAGVPVAVGADRWNQTSKAEADFMARHGFFDRPTLLDLWTRVTPQAVFPGRAVGRLAPGFEASLLALACDPLAEWSCTERIEHREKQGVDLGESAAPAETASGPRGP